MHAKPLQLFSHSLRLYGPYLARLLYPWDSLGVGTLRCKGLAMGSYMCWCFHFNINQLWQVPYLLWVHLLYKLGTVSPAFSGFCETWVNSRQMWKFRTAPKYSRNSINAFCCCYNFCCLYKRILKGSSVCFSARISIWPNLKLTRSQHDIPNGNTEDRQHTFSWRSFLSSVHPG